MDQLEQEHTQNTIQLINNLKNICSINGLGNASSEYKIITEVFLYKFLNDKFLYEARNVNNKLKNSDDIVRDLQNLSDNEYKLILIKIGARAAKFKKSHFISILHGKQNEDNFHNILDTTLIEIADENIELYSVSTISEEKLRLFDKVSQYITNTSEKDPFCRAIINALAQFSFEPIFEEKYDFFSTIFEYLIKDYNKDSGQYAEYYTPRSVAKIIARILVPEPVKNVVLYDPAAGSGSLLLALAHEIGEDKCSIFSQDISQKSSEFLRLNLVLNNLVHSLDHVIKGNTLKDPYHKNDQKNDLKKFDYVVSNPPFKTDFSADRDLLASDQHSARFFAGVPNILKKKKEKMEIYLLFIQHIIYSLADNGKAAIVVPTGFITAQSGIAKNIRVHLVENKMLRGVISMPSNIFANTGTNVSVLFIDKSNKKGDIVLMDASKLGETITIDNNQKTGLKQSEENDIVNTFNSHEPKEDFAVVVSYDDIAKKNYSLSAGQYFDVKIEYTDITAEEFKTKMDGFKQNLDQLFNDSKKLEDEIKKQLAGLKYE